MGNRKGLGAARGSAGRQGRRPPRHVRSRGRGDRPRQRGHAWRPGKLAPIEVGNRRYVLCRMLDGSYAFFDGLCTHGNTSLSDGYLDGCLIECPKHNARFDVRTGEAVRRPAVKPLGTYPVRVQGGHLVVTLPPPEGQAGTAVLSSDVTA